MTAHPEQLPRFAATPQQAQPPKLMSVAEWVDLLGGGVHIEPGRISLASLVTLDEFTELLAGNDIQLF